MHKREKVFVSSTCYDLIDARAEIEQMLRDMGLDPCLSDSSGSNFDVAPTKNSIEACLINVRSSDIVIVMLSSRYGPTLEAFGYPGVSATHLEYQEAKKARKPIYFYARAQLIADHTIWKNNKRSTAIEYAFVQKLDDHGLFQFLEERRRAFGKREVGGSNWYSTFNTTLDLKQAIRRQLRGHVEVARLRQELVGGNFSRYLCDIVEGLVAGRAGVRFSTVLGPELGTWQLDVLNMLMRLFQPRAKDVAVVWLSPAGTPRKLVLRRSQGLDHLPFGHYEFSPREGLAGKVWLSGEAAAHSAEAPHEGWAVRTSCPNATYLCAPVGAFEDGGGVLGVGSDEGFPLSDVDLSVVKVFAGILALSSAPATAESRELKVVSVNA